MTEEVTTTDPNHGYSSRRQRYWRGPFHRVRTTSRLFTILVSLVLVLTSLPLTAVVTAAKTRATWTELFPVPIPPHGSVLPRPLIQTVARSSSLADTKTPTT